MNRSMADAVNSAALRSNQGAAFGSPACFQGHRQLLGSRFPPKRLAKASASSGLAKQNTTKSLSSRRRESVRGFADRTPAVQNMT
jgi:hypothetical protein